MSKYVQGIDTIGPKAYPAGDFGLSMLAAANQAAAVALLGDVGGAPNPTNVRFVSAAFAGKASPFFASIQAAIDSLGTGSPTLVVVYPGTYSESITLKANMTVYAMPGAILAPMLYPTFAAVDGENINCNLRGALTIDLSGIIGARALAMGCGGSSVTVELLDVIALGRPDSTGGAIRLAATTSSATVDFRARRIVSLTTTANVTVTAQVAHMRGFLTLDGRGTFRCDRFEGRALVQSAGEWELFIRQWSAHPSYNGSGATDLPCRLRVDAGGRATVHAATMLPAWTGTAIHNLGTLEMIHCHIEHSGSNQRVIHNDGGRVMLLNCFVWATGSGDGITRGAIHGNGYVDLHGCYIVQDSAQAYHFCLYQEGYTSDYVFIEGTQFSKAGALTFSIGAQYANTYMINAGNNVATYGKTASVLFRGAADFAYIGAGIANRRNWYSV